ncbi:hypothetical protein L6164_036008 [Bauhinia variegata]|uniref:Uncharacterized protein n=1 Tax=Bauhinia variegata TaxID=167791 RepID=A0ACB9KFP2_BAUVA|nr:hypothetical protein L6164_036008 [Bauhinia variegata]
MVEVDAEPFVESDPTGRYGRYEELLGSGAVKKVYRAFDQEKGIEVAWNQVSLRRFVHDENMMKRLFSEITLLKSLKHDNIIALYHEWTDTEKRALNFITEYCTSGNLRNYRKKHRLVSMRAIKKWCRQILWGLEYLHQHEPCIIHRDINCSNIFINGNLGQIKIGDFGLATALEGNHRARAMIGTSEFMAPELYEDNYTWNVDVYSFAMCLLEMVTREIPYSECNNVAQIYKMVASGKRPKEMDKIKDPEVKSSIEKCLDAARPSA